DLEGTAHLVLEPTDEGTLAEVSWTIEMRQRPMRLAARVAHPFMRWGHDRVVEATVLGYRRHLAAEYTARRNEWPVLPTRPSSAPSPWLREPRAASARQRPPHWRRRGRVLRWRRGAR